MASTGPTKPRPEVPAGWKAVWSEEHFEWFFVNLQTSQSSWDIPKEMDAPAYTEQKQAVVAASELPARNGTNGGADTDRLPTYADAREARRQGGIDFEKEILADYDFEDASAVSNSAVSQLKAWSRKDSCNVLIKRYSKKDPKQVAAVQRELNALYILGGNDEAIPPLLDYFDPSETVYVITRNRDDQSLREYVEKNGALNSDLLKAVVTQLMSALSIIFTNGFAHLNLCDETLYLDANGQLTIKDFQYAVEYGKEKTDTLYAAVGHEVKGVEGIWCAPEVFAAEREGTQYNGRKAVLWSCGVVLYYMATGQLEKLSNLDHPVFINRRKSSSKATEPTPTHESITIQSKSDDRPNAPAELNGAEETRPQQPRRLSLLNAYRRRSSAAAGTLPSSSSSSSNPSGSHSRKSSLTPNIPTPHTLISYPGNRLDVPSYARDIISKMLILNPMDRAELIEVAAKVPKELATKSTRPLMELAWQDYKTHVGPYAGMGLGAEEWNSNTGDGGFYGGGYGAGYADSVYSGFSGIFGKKR